METLASRFANASPPSVEELQSISTFSDLPAEGLAWLAAHMGVIDLESGEITVQQGDPADHMVVILRGEIGSEAGNGRLWRATAGQVTGLLPFSRLTHYPGTARTSGQPPDTAGAGGIAARRRGRLERHQEPI